MAEKREKLKYKEYKARIEMKDSTGTPQYMFTTWRGDIIDKVLDATVEFPFEKGNTIIIEMIPVDKDFTDNLFTEI